MIASVSGVFNAVMVSGDIVDDTLYYGRGAGRLPTASAVLGDVAAVARQIATQSHHHLPAFIPEGDTPTIESIDEVSCRHYLRITVTDEPGVLAQITAILGNYEVSIARMIQIDSDADGSAEMVMLTHSALEKNCREAVTKIDELGVVKAPTVRYRVEEFS